MRRFSIFPLVILLFSSCEKKKEILDKGTWTDAKGNSQTWDQYLLRDSCFKSWYENGKVVRLMRSGSKEEMGDSTFVDDAYFVDGNKRSFRKEAKGKAVGIWKEWFENGEQRSKHTFANGKEIDFFSWFEDGSPEIEATTDDAGNIIGHYYSKDHSLMIMQVDSVGTGRIETFFPNGKPKESGEIFMKQRTGIWHSWDSLGNQLKDSLYGLPRVK